MQNNIFQFDRFFKLMKRGITHQPKKKLQMVIGFTGIPILAFLINISNGRDIFDVGSRANFLSAIVFVIFIASPFTFFKEINHPKRGLIDAMLPASTLEKYLLMQLTCVIVAPLIPIVLYGGMDFILASIFPNILQGFALSEFLNFKASSWEFYVMLFVTQQLIFFFNLHFVANKQIKTLASIILIPIVMISIFLLMIKLFASDFFTNYDHNMNINIPSGKSLMIHQGDPLITVLIQLWRIFADIVLPVILVIGSYFRMKTIRY